MRSPNEARPWSLRTRVAFAAALVAALVGLVSAGVAALLLDRLEAAAQDRRLLDSAALMQHELESEQGDPQRLVDDEAAEILPLGLRIAMFEDGARKGGTSDLPFPHAEGCATQQSASGAWRSCASFFGARRIVVSTHRDRSDSGRGILLLAVGAAALLSAVVSALASRALAGWALAPLTALGERLGRITSASSDAADLGEPSGSAEVEAVREALRGLLGRLGEEIERSRGFAAAAAHELRTPLATMLAELELASEQAPRVSDALSRVRRTVGRMTVLVERLLVLASGTGASGAGMQLVTEAVAMEDVVREVVAARPDAERARIVTDLESSGMVRGDEALLRIVVDNLIDNALKFSRTGDVRVRVDEQEREIRLTVQDEGPGIDPGEAERLLRPFTRGRGSDAAVPGHGLGLSIVAHAVRLHGGEVTFVPREGRGGAELRVTIPAWRAHTAE